MRISPAPHSTCRRCPASPPPTGSPATASARRPFQLAGVLAVALVAALLAAHTPAPGTGPAVACRPALALVAALGLLGLFVGLTGLIRTPPSSLHHGE
ncbi:hypothetical protein [Streptomyces hyaluromycini]|uniref:hypothetical protein n=1 Tax=Streptomyces hyaluromycini TaxID=1377993 RepID=UPI0011AE2EB6|nr:hypothetical protein [Streptomyces hyaluromycini]